MIRTIRDFTYKEVLIEMPADLFRCYKIFCPFRKYLISSLVLIGGCQYTRSVGGKKRDVYNFLVWPILLFVLFHTQCFPCTSCIVQIGTVTSSWMLGSLGKNHPSPILLAIVSFVLSSDTSSTRMNVVCSHARVRVNSSD